MEDVRRIGINKNYWYPVAFLKEIERNRTHAVAFAGDPIVLYRDQNGQIHALEDTCAHRQIALSRGEVKGDHLVCCYHGWEYDPSGRCVHIPNLPEGRPIRIAIRSYPVQCRYGLAWIFPGGPDLSDRTALPQISGWDDPSTLRFTFARKIACHYSFLFENLLDMNHNILHKKYTGRNRVTLLDLKASEESVTAEYLFELMEGTPHLGARILGGKGSGGEEGKGDLMSIRCDYPYLTLSLHRAGASKESFWMWASCVPTDRLQKHRQVFGYLLIPGLSNRFFTPGARWFIRRLPSGIFQEDYLMVEEEQRAYDAQEENRNREVYPVIFSLQTLIRRKGEPLPEGG